jgi:adenylylsulfate kinase
LAFTGQKLVAHGVTVVFDATASCRVYRDFARSIIPRFIEVAVECSLATSWARPERTIERASGESLTVRGYSLLRSADQPDLRIDTTTTPSGDAARQI